MIIQADSLARVGKFVDGLPFVNKPFGRNATYAAWMPSLGLADTKGRNVTKVGTVSLVPSSEGIVSSHSDVATNLIRVALPNSTIGTMAQGATLIVVFSLPASYSGTDKRIVALGSEQGSAGNTVFSIGTGAAAASQLRVTAGGSDTNASSDTSGKSINDGQFHCAILSVWDFYSGANGKYAAALDGSLVISETGTGSPLGISNAYSALVAGGFRRGGTDNSGATCNIALAMVVPRMSAAEIAHVSGNPRMLFHPEALFLWTPDAGGGAAELVGSAAGQVAATGALTTQIPLAGAAVEVATATGSLTTQIPLAGAAASGAVADGVLTTTITLSGSALAQVVASATLAGGAAALSGSAAESATATGALTTQITLSGAAVMQALATAGLTTAPAGLAGSAAAIASGSGALFTGIPLVGQASALAIATGGLSTGIRLTGSAASVSAATGNLTITTGLSAAAFAQAAVAGTLSTQIRLDAAAVAQALASAGLSTGGSVDPFDDPRYTLRFAARNSTLTARARNWGVSIQ